MLGVLEPLMFVSGIITHNNGNEGLYVTCHETLFVKKQTKKQQFNTL